MASLNQQQSYSRKDKSLGLLCSKFLFLYNKSDGGHLICLNDAASQLGVEKRRIYDIVNILESLWVISRKAKNQYTWKGFSAIPLALQHLKVLDGEDDQEETCSINIGSQKNTNSSTLVKSFNNENRKEKSLTLLTQNFIKLFLCSNIEMISLDDAAELLLTNAHDTSIMKTKVRRLYDIANVLSTLNLIEKIQIADTRKPAFKWVGPEEKTTEEKQDSRIFLSLSEPNESRRRLFGIDPSSNPLDFKREQVDLFEDENSNIIQKNHGCQAKPERSNLKRYAAQEETSTMSFQFGPFAPEDEASENQVPDWESLANDHCPRYQSPVLIDLFSHYTEAWKLWFSEVHRKRRKKEDDRKRALKIGNRTKAVNKNK